ncbi:MAG: glycosyltransferase family 2 protein [bacterium]|nr:glycosyltransferase family 2 protein [bacterium]
MPRKLNKNSLSVIVPVYNSELTLKELFKRIDNVLSLNQIPFEIILVNDGSDDYSWDVIKDLSEKHSHIKGINLMTNYGQQNALLAGIRHAQYDKILTIDDDLQHPPEEIPKLWNKLNEGYDIVFGRPLKRRHKKWRNLSSKILKLTLFLVLGSKMTKHTSSFRLFRSELCRGFVKFYDAQLSINVLLSWSAKHITSVPVEHHPRKAGKSTYTTRKLLILAFTILTGYSTLPLRIASALGLMTSFFGLGLFLYVVIKRLFQTSYVPGFTFLASEIAIFAGLLLFAIGIIGEYLARLHFRTMGKPPYVIRDKT